MKNNKMLSMREPAFKWEEATPLGNGSFGAMAFGRTSQEIIELNEDTFWSGKPLEDEGFNMTSEIEKARELIDQEKYIEARKHITESMKHGHWTQNYLPIGNISIDFKHKGEVIDYRRELDMEKGIMNVSYSHEGVGYEREYFISKVDDVLVIHLKASKYAKIRCFIDFNSLVKHEVKPLWDHLVVKGEAPIHVDPIYDMKDEPIIYDEKEQGIQFGSVIKVYTDGAVMTNGKTLSIQNGTEATIYMACKTNFVDCDTASEASHRNPVQECKDLVDQAMKKGYKQIRQDHIKDFSSLMNRVELGFGKSHHDEKGIDEKINAMINNPDRVFDPGLAATLFQFGRYLIVSGSREGSQATNLQGIWNNLMQAAWCSNYTININTEMNYWPVDVANLMECSEPLVDLVTGLGKKGHVAAKGYGCGGWTAHHNTDIWHQTLPVSGDAQYSFWPYGGPWLTLNLYERYRFNMDKEYLARIFDTMKGAVEFCLDWSYEENGHLTTSPSTSPENSFKDGKGNRCCITKNATMDSAIMWELFDQFEEACSELGCTELPMLARVQEAKEKLLPIQLTGDGRIMEYNEDFEEVDKGHRHISHLLNLYPGKRVNTDEDTALLEGFKKSLEARLANGGGHTSWSCAWCLLIAARLKDKDYVTELLGKFQKYSVIKNGLSSHPPFQIDGNYGILAGMCEMLIQSHMDYVELVPVLGEGMESGYFKGLRARGGFEIEATWEDGRVLEARVKSDQGNSCKLKVNGELYTVDCQSGVWSQVELG